MLTDKIQLGNLAIYAVKGQCSEDKTPHTVMVTLNARVNSVDELTHKRKYVARHGGERVGDAWEETTSQTAARLETRRCIRWTGVAAPMKNPSWPWIKADTPKAQYMPKCG